MVTHSLGSNSNLSTTVMSIYFISDITARAVMSKGIGNIIDKISLKRKGMGSVMKNILLTVIALCVAC